MHLLACSLRLTTGIAVLAASGWAAACLLRSPARFVSAFLLSLLTLFHVILWLQIAGVPITFGTVFPVLAAVSAALTWIALRRNRVRLTFPRPALPASREDRVLCCAIAVAGCVMVARFLFQPLRGWDTPFRWNFLALRMLELRNFGFYPPVNAADYEIYFYPDGMPPLVSFTYFWTYASFGRPLPVLAALFVIVQLVVLADLLRRTAQALFGGPSGLYAVALASSSSLLFLAMFWGQETGLTAISLTGTVYFIVVAAGDNTRSNMILAGAAAALGALAREYGCAFLLCGLLACAWRKQRLRDVVVFTGVFAALAGPWYVRNWIVAGNPFYTNPATAGLFHVNPVHVGILAGYSRVLGFSVNKGAYLSFLWHYLLLIAPLQVTLGIAASVLFLKRAGYVALSCLAVVVLWIYSVGQTSGGICYSMRVLSPCLALLSVLGAGLLVRVSRTRLQARLLVAALCVSVAFGALQDVVMPTNVFNVSPLRWPALGFTKEDRTDHEFLRIAALLPAGTRLLGTNPYYHADLRTPPNDLPPLVPAWSPEFSFLFDPGVPGPEAAVRLAETGVTHILHHPTSKANWYTHRFSFFRDLPQFAVLIYKTEKFWLFRLEPDKQE